MTPEQIAELRQIADDMERGLARANGETRTAYVVPTNDELGCLVCALGAIAIARSGTLPSPTIAWAATTQVNAMELCTGLMPTVRFVHPKTDESNLPIGELIESLHLEKQWPIARIAAWLRSTANDAERAQAVAS